MRRPSRFNHVWLLAAVGVLACAPKPEDVANGDDPIRALGVYVTSSRYGPPFWAEQRRLDSDVWHKAVAFCTPARAPELPNCQPVVANAEAARGHAHLDSVLRRIGEQARQRR